MKILKTDFLKEDDLLKFIDLYRKLTTAARPLFTVTEWKQLRKLVVSGIEAGVYDRDNHEISQLLHSLGTSLVLIKKIGVKKSSMLTVLLDPMMQHGVITKEEILKWFGDDTAHLIECMSRVKDLYSKHDSMQDENFRKLLLSFAEDIRVIICLIADRYVLMKMLNHTNDTQYRSQVINECRLLYTPMAHRLGLYSIKSDLEDMAVKYEYREIYDDIARQLNETKKAREEYIENFIAPVKRRLEETTNLKFTIKGRTKSISSVWNKLKSQNTTIDNIYDLFAIRIVIDSPLDKEKAQCWQAYSIITDMYQPNPKRLKDWLSIPKSNGYESLHITVYGPQNKWVEVQIRTKRMDDIAERGIAAHWSYKGLRSEGAADQLIANIREILEHNSSPDELMKDLSMDFYQEEIFVFTPNGDVHKLPKGATVLDFAFDIHTKLGLSCVGARVGGRNVKINYPLHSGETVEILTSSGQTPKLDWLNIVATSKARVRIRQGLKEIENREAEGGRELLKRRFKNRKIDISESELARVILKMGYKAQTQFFHALSEEDVTVDDVLKTYEEMQTRIIPGDSESHHAEDFNIDLIQVETQKNNRQRSSDDDVMVIDGNLRDIDYKLAGCCHPIFGDDVIGFVSVNGGIKIHRTDCPNIKRMQERFPYRIVRARWSGKYGSKYGINLHIVGNDDISIVSNISSIINKDNDAILRSINIDSNDGLFQGNLTVMVSDLSSLKTLIKKIQQIKGVKQVSRIN
jgi:GTP diphosphokinase / guanosine-3',5'-bis(diphosphate) 3'-diphosphatase